MSKVKELLQVKYINIRPSESITNYIQKKIAKHDAESKEITSLTCNISIESTRAGKTYCVTLETSLLHSGFIVREKGNDVYKIIDDLSDKFRNRVVKMIDKQSNYPTSSPLSMEAEYLSAFVQEPNTPYSPLQNQAEPVKHLILERKRYFDNSPIRVEEAIQMLELVGRPCLLFKNFETGKYTVIYRVESQQGVRGYGLLEHKD